MVSAGCGGVADAWWCSFWFVCSASGVGSSWSTSIRVVSWPVVGALETDCVVLAACCAAASRAAATAGVGAAICGTGDGGEAVMARDCALFVLQLS